MKERLLDLLPQINRVAFISGRGDVIKGGHEAVIYKRKDLDVVVKELTDPNAINGYLLAVELLGQDLLAHTSLVENLRINVDHELRTIKSAVIQERVRPLEEEFIGLVKQSEVDRLMDLIRKKVVLDREILEKGVFIQDPELKNCGVRGNGEVVFIDPGRAVLDPSGDELHLTRVVNRGWTHYSIVMRLQYWGRNNLANVLDNRNQLADVYISESGLTFDPQIDSSTHLLLAFRSAQELANFTGRTHAALAQEELDKWFPRRIPPNPEAETLGFGHLDGWITRRDSNGLVWLVERVIS